MNLLFICSKNRLRSPTGEEIFSQMEGFYAASCGLSKEALTKLSKAFKMKNETHMEAIVYLATNPVKADTLLSYWKNHDNIRLI